MQDRERDTDVYNELGGKKTYKRSRIEALQKEGKGH